MNGAARLRADYRHPLSPDDVAALDALRARAVARGYAVLILSTSHDDLTRLIAIAPSPTARGGSAQTEASAASGT